MRQTAVRRRLETDDVACWLLKTSTPPAQVSPGWRAGEVRVLRRCVRPTYRLGLMAAGQPCVLWLSGATSPGVHAAGRLTAPPRDGDRLDASPTVEVALRLLPAVVARHRLVHRVGFAGAEVVRMAAGGNPSYLTAPQLAALLDEGPQLLPF